MAKGAKTKRARRERRERRFEPQSTASPALVGVVGALGATALGAGAYGQFARAMLEPGEAMPYASWVLAGGALVLGAAIWIGTSGDAPVRVGDAGVATEKGGLVRLPWHAIETVRWQEQAQAVLVDGKDETGTARTLSFPARVYPQAAAWITREARERIPMRVEVPETSGLPEASEAGVELLALDPPQVVGKRCAVSGTIVSYEPDARVCPRCELVYHKDHVPDACACGASLADLRSAKAATKTKGAADEEEASS
jgi:hypothetical protein